jgi:hypothetical protein
MNTTETERPPAAAETFILAKCDEGFRVCSPLTPAKQFVVNGLPENPRCNCPDFARQDGDPEYVCNHILAVLRETGLAIPPQGSPPTAPGGDRGPVDPTTATARKGAGGKNGNGAVMLLKRSVSPDGRIDSLSVEFSCPIGKATTEELKQRAGRILALQADIASGFLRTNGNGRHTSNDDATAVPGQLLAVASMNGKWGRRLFLNVLVNGQVLKLFGSEKQLAEAVTGAGFGSVAQSLTEGNPLNLPCRVVTKPSPDGKYINIERVLPAQAAAPTRS